jgi:hypothetical protein
MLGSLFSAGGSLLGGLLDGDGGVGEANAANAALNRRINQLFQEMGQREALRFREATGLFQNRLDSVMDTLDRADASVGGAERSAQRAATTRRDQNSANLQQQLQSSGFRNSTIAANAQRGVNNDYERTLGNISAQAGQQRAGLATQRAGFQSSLMGDLANLPLLRNSAETSRLQNFASALEKQYHTPSGEKGGFGDLFGALGGAMGESGSISNFFGSLGGFFS